MDFISEYFYVIMGIAFMLLVISTARMFGRPSKNDDERKMYIKTFIENSGGKVIGISKM